MNARIDGSNLIITIPMNPSPTPSASQKSLVVASTHGAMTTPTQINGKNLIINLNAYIKP